MPIKAGSTVYSFQNWFRPSTTHEPVVQPVRIVEGPPIETEDIPSILCELNDRQFGAVREVLIEAKLRSESLIRDEKVVSDHGRLAYYAGWVAYADYILANLEALREKGKEIENFP